MARDELSLENLTMFDFDPAAIRAHMAEEDAKEQRYKELYGDQWRERMYADWDREQAIARRKWINSLIYDTGRLSFFPADRVSAAEKAEFDERLHALYGDQYGVLTASRVDRDPRVAELLIQEALRDHAPELLPDELCGEYARRQGSDL